MKLQKSEVNFRREIFGVLLIGVFLFLAVAFFTHHSTDNSLFYFSSEKRSILNWCGAFGAHISALFFFLFGGASYLLLFSIISIAVLLFSASSLKETIIRTSLLPLLILSGTLLLQICSPNSFVAMSGGAIGVSLSSLATPIFGRVGIVILATVLSWVSVLVLLRVSLVKFVVTLGSIFAFLCLSAFQFIKKFFSRRMVVEKRDQISDIVFDESPEEQRVYTSPEVMLEQVPPAQTQSEQTQPKVEYEVPNFASFQEQRKPTSDRNLLEERCRERGKKLEEKLERFGINGVVTAIRPGPVVTLFEYKPEIDSKISKIVSLEDDLAMALTAVSIRIIAPIPGRNVVGFEISNQSRQDVFLSDVLRDDKLKNFSGDLPLALGVDITGNSVCYDLVSMPHLLVAGSTGSGKSVGLNSMLVSLLCSRTPDELKLILIDPKRLEFAPYADIPHLLFPIVTNPRKAIPVLKWVVQEMEDRYDLMARVGARSIVDYQKIYEERGASEDLPSMPFIVLIIDELADLMMVAGKDVETYIARTAQMARAAGIHMVVATQRPSVDVVTGIIKVNFPARIAFRVSSKIDSRTIIDSSGAEKLLGRGDMLLLNSGSSALERIHGAYVSGQEIARLTSFLRSQRQVEYLDLNEALDKQLPEDENHDELYDDIRSFVKTIDEVSISMLQRKYRIGFNRSARIIEKLEIEGAIAPSQGGKTRKVIR